MEKLVIERTLPVQGEPVNVYFHGSRGKSGQLILTYEEWLHFNKLLREGMENLKRKNETRIEIVIKGVGGKVGLVSQVLSGQKKTLKKVSDEEVQAILGGISQPLELDGEDEAEVEKAEKEQKLIRSLLPEGEENESN